MSTEPVPTCRSCGAEIRFVRFANGRTMPVDREPDEELGNILVERGVAEVLTITTQLAAVRAERPLYVSHFATCRYAKVHRRRPTSSAAAKREEAGQGALFG